jgi:hypothetical protein
MKAASTIETMAVVTPNCDIARRSQIISYSKLQNPETKKNAKYQIGLLAFTGASVYPSYFPALKVASH